MQIRTGTIAIFTPIIEAAFSGVPHWNPVKIEWIIFTFSNMNLIILSIL